MLLIILTRVITTIQVFWVGLIVNCLILSYTCDKDTLTHFRISSKTFYHLLWHFLNTGATRVALQIHTHRSFKNETSIYNTITDSLILLNVVLLLPPIVLVVRFAKVIVPLNCLRYSTLSFNNDLDIINAKCHANTVLKIRRFFRHRAGVFQNHIPQFVTVRKHHRSAIISITLI